MKKVFALFLALMLLFLTACNTKPSHSGTTDRGQNAGNPSDDMKDRIIIGSRDGLVDITSRILFAPYISDYPYHYYYSKADGKAYPYCFDPLCDHESYDCMASLDIDFVIQFKWTFFVNGRFYNVTPFGEILSFAFDGSDRKLEYDSEYDGNISIWNSSPIVYKDYIYIGLQADENGNPHTLRFNTVTKQMEDLTEKTGHCVIPIYIYNDVIYGFALGEDADKVYGAADLDLNSVEVAENFCYPDFAVGSISINDDRMYGVITLHDFKTNERWELTKEMLGVDHAAVVAATEDYIYFYNAKTIVLGKTTVILRGQEKEVDVEKRNDGKLWRINLDGTGLVCVYDNFDYELSTDMEFYEDRVVMMGRYIHFENGVKEVWGGALQVAVINEDGTFGEFREVEIVG